MPYSEGVKKDEFETALLNLWMTTVIPLTEVNLRYHTGVPRRRMRKWLDQMVQDGHLDIDSDDDGHMVYRVPGARRAAGGPRTFAERDRLHALTRQVQPRGQGGQGGQGDRRVVRRHRPWTRETRAGQTRRT